MESNLISPALVQITVKTKKGCICREWPMTITLFIPPDWFYSNCLFVASAAAGCSGSPLDRKYIFCCASQHNIKSIVDNQSHQTKRTVLFVGTLLETQNDLHGHWCTFLN